MHWFYNDVFMWLFLLLFISIIAFRAVKMLKFVIWRVVSGSFNIIAHKFEGVKGEKCL